LIDKNSIKCQCEYCDLRDLFFSHVSSDMMNEICDSREELSYEKGDVVIVEGDAIINFMYLKEGLVKLFRTDDHGKSQIITIGKPIDFVSLLSVFSDQHYKYSVTALENSVICVISMNTIRNLSMNNAPFAVGVMQKMSKISDDIIIDFLEIRKKHLRGRTAHVLLFFAEEIYLSDNFELPISRKEIAEYIGMTAENVIRTLSEFRKDNFIRINGKLIEIIDKDRLRMISEHG